jgi:purine-nucleoside phosphorylase
MSVHIGAAEGAIADIVLLPGDPLRAKFAADEFLTDVTCYNEVRGMYGYTGTWKGRRVSVQGTGMGIPSLSIYVNELLQDYGCKTLIRIGSCGSYQRHVHVNDVVLAMTASTDSAHNRLRFNGMDYAPCADYGLFRRACELAEERTMTYHAGGIVSSDSFYQDDPEAWKHWAQYGVLAVEMEANALYTLASRAGARALAICTVSDSLVSREVLDADQRRSGFREMIELALDTGIGA